MDSLGLDEVSQAIDAAGHESASAMAGHDWMVRRLALHSLLRLTMWVSI